MSITLDYSIFSLAQPSGRSGIAHRQMKQLLKKCYGGDDFVIHNNNTLSINQKKIYYSKSYTDTAGIVVISNTPVGVDIEYTKPRKIELRDIASDIEIAIAAPRTPTMLSFYKVWCSKEAAMKVIQKSFSFKDYIIVDTAPENRLTIKYHETLLNIYNFVSNKCTYSFAIHSIYEQNNPRIRKSNF
jgi:phosphopantetheinyl transferase (holo-ACP synthase)